MHKANKENKLVVAQSKGQDSWRCIYNPVNHLNYYPKKMNVQVASPVAKRLQTYDIWKIEIFKKIPELFVNYCLHHAAFFQILI